MNVLRARLVTGFLLGLELFSNQLALANPTEVKEIRYYDVEIVIIENITEKARKSESWPVNIKIEQPEKTVLLGQPIDPAWLTENVGQAIDPTEAYKILPAESYQLAEYVNTISESENQRVIFHISWRQPGLDSQMSVPVYFTQDIPAPPDIENSTQVTTDNSVDETDANEPAAFKIKNATLEGLLRVTLSRYLHLESELALRNKVNDKIKTASEETSVSLNENPFAILDAEEKAKHQQDALEKQQVIYLNQKRRRMRSKELHYIDHPVISMLVLMTPYEKPEEAEDTSASNKK